MADLPLNLPDALPTSSIDDDEEAPAPPTRPNRYLGPPLTWRRWTESDRLIHESLQRQRNIDLSWHLYCTYALKARRWRGRLLGAERRCDDDDDVFVPPTRWTAWPLPPQMVPREGERYLIRREEEEIERFTVKRREKVRGSRVLEEELLGVMLRIGRERFKEREREWDFEDQVTRMAGGYALKDEEGKLFLPPPRPVPLADDDLALALLRPTIRHILSVLDGLLLSLHYARRSYLWDNEDGVRRSSIRIRGTTARSKRQGSSTASNTTSEPTSNPEHSDPTTTDQKPRDSPSRSTMRHINPLDWSSVLGLAALTPGISSAALSRTADRCASLFGEGMSFRTFLEGDTAAEEVHYTPHGIVPSDKNPRRGVSGRHSRAESQKDTPTSSRSRATSTTRRKDAAIYICTEPGCLRAKRGNGFTRAKYLRGHVKRMHNPEADGDGNSEELIQHGGESSGRDPGEEDEGSGTAQRADHRGGSSHQKKRRRRRFNIGDVNGGIHNDGFLEPIVSHRGWTDGGVKRGRGVRDDGNSGGGEGMTTSGEDVR
ncbi:MAG: hypothetical protein M1817_000120 [Caeruleum heppii]|nr:MAG: hypothetical protein M1817_000120 [Caeruleum heppii]